ncbi:protein-disulfide isomerase [Lactobacillus helveticus]|uniref:Protein-disulfide isomerase n=2 Tax=Lactobacillus helveticus TaxID=1587 RepID=A0AAJ4CXV6_LACHE|nr:protein-disulfide isomerase [Lactobacillus helveticus]CDI57587.1 Protein-disulfide isomerase [Lactobacillus helveticus CIRM-BIA 951]AQY53958.1 protein-disulfide isomerase [Lactobacillus helveticus]AUI73814.1 protein-disulfide isomerase [Lactobacillus helveticus]AUI75760.1 protein-disulfide isomerase [Lactobacillus helveticus]
MAFYDDTKLELKSFQLNPMEAKTAKIGDYINHFTSGKKELEADAKQKMAYIS